MPHSVSPDSSPPTKTGEVPDAAPPLSDDVPSSPALPAAQKQQADLEAMFDDDDDDEMTESDAVTSSAPQAPLKASASPTDPEVMRAFYQRLFPHRYLFQWLNHSPSPTNDFAHREFAFTLPNDAYLRYQSFPTADLFRKALVTHLPTRFEIGPVYSTNPRERKTLRRAAAFRPLTKELVFDIDMTDYDSIRTCCSGGEVCNQCWGWIRMAIKVVDIALREDFGWKHILWVYSGRRGVHAWVCDRSARELNDDQRKAIAGYLELLKGGEARGKLVNVRRPLHSHIERSLHTLRHHFQTDVLRTQDPWCSTSLASTNADVKPAHEHLLNLLAAFPELTAALSKKWSATPARSSSSKWSDIDAVASSGTLPNLDTKKLLEAKQDIVLEYTYPRLDSAVSKHLNHLLKSPFCIHPKTGRVCVPMDIRQMENFDPCAVPNVVELLGEIDEWNRKDAGPKDGIVEDDNAPDKIADWEKTSLKPYVEYFRGFVNALLKEEKNEKRRRESEEPEPMEF